MARPAINSTLAAGNFPGIEAIIGNIRKRLPGKPGQDGGMGTVGTGGGPYGNMGPSPQTGGELRPPPGLQGRPTSAMPFKPAPPPPKVAAPKPPATPEPGSDEAFDKIPEKRENPGSWAAAAQAKAAENPPLPSGYKSPRLAASARPPAPRPAPGGGGMQNTTGGPMQAPPAASGPQQQFMQAFNQEGGPYQWLKDKGMSPEQAMAYVGKVGKGPLAQALRGEGGPQADIQLPGGGGQAPIASAQVVPGSAYSAAQGATPRPLPQPGGGGQANMQLSPGKPTQMLNAGDLMKRYPGATMQPPRPTMPPSGGGPNQSLFMDARQQPDGSFVGRTPDGTPGGSFPRQPGGMQISTGPGRPTVGISGGLGSFGGGGMQNTTGGGLQPPSPGLNIQAAPPPGGTWGGLGQNPTAGSPLDSINTQDPASIAAIQGAMPAWMTNAGTSAEQALAFARKNPEGVVAQRILAALGGGGGATPTLQF